MHPYIYIEQDKPVLSGFSGCPVFRIPNGRGRSGFSGCPVFRIANGDVVGNWPGHLLVWTRQWLHCSPGLSSHLLCHSRIGWELCRPCVDVKICNLSESSLSVLPGKDPIDICTGVVVTNVEKDNPGYSYGLLRNDVIVKYDMNEVQSKIQFFETIWDNVGKSMSLLILRDGQLLELDISLGETSLAKFYRWKIPPPTNVAVPLPSTYSDLFGTSSDDDVSSRLLL